ncbi:hypothetical protein [Streptomyces sp. NPDC057889]
MTVAPGLGTASRLVSVVMTLKGIDLHNTKFVTRRMKSRQAASRCPKVGY